MRYVGIDCEATNTRGILINPKTGEIIQRLFDIENNEIKDNSDLYHRISSAIFSLVGSSSDTSKVVGIGICAAGLVDEASLDIIFSPNFKNIRGRITFPSLLSNKGYLVSSTNDMRGATYGEVYFGKGKGKRNVADETCSSGNNYSVFAEDGLIKRIIEGGHQLFKPGSGVFCGCGGEGHLEPFISGNGAAAMAQDALRKRGIPYHTILEEVVKDKNGLRYSHPKLVNEALEVLQRDSAYRKEMFEKITAKHVYRAFRKNPKENPQARIRDIQVDAIGFSISQLVSNQSPLDMIIYMGSQTKDWDILFEPAIERYKSSKVDYHHPNLPSPEIVRSEDSDIGAKGAIVDFAKKYNLHLFD